MRVQKPTPATRRDLVSKSASTALVAALRTSIVIASLSMASTSAFAGSKLFTFDDDSTAELIIFSNTTDPVRAEGGQSGGYLAITDAIDSKFGTIIFPDIDDGKPVAGFTLECDVRIGNSSDPDGRPADGLAVSYARASDPLLINGELNKADPNYNIQQDFSVNGAPEMGSRTGIAVSFDTWQGNTYLDGTIDVEGLMIQVDGKVVKTYALPTRNGACDDITSLETGPWDATTAGSPDGLCWTKLKVDLATDGKLTVAYKGATILDRFQTAFSPSAGRIVFSGRTGGNNANQHVDNVSLVTIPAEAMLGSGAIDTAFTWRAVFTDNVATGSVLDPATVSFQLDGVPVVPVRSEKVGDDTTYFFTRDFATPFLSTSEHTAKLTAKDTKGATLDVLRVMIAPGYTLIPASLAAGIDDATAERGFKYRVQWNNALQRALGNTDANRTFFAERQINEAYLDATGAPVANEATLDGIDENGYINIDGAVNFDQQGANAGNFTTATGKPEALYPGMPSLDNNNFTVEFSGYALLEPGAYRFAVNSDDGFKHTVGRGLSDMFGIKLGEFDGGRGASDTTYDLVVLQRGLYPMRWLQWEAGGGANVEIFTINTDGSRHLVNDPDDEASIKVFRSGLAKSHLRLMSPVPDQIGGAVAESPITIQVVDGAAPVGPIAVKIDGILQSTPITKSGNVSTFHIEYANGQDPGDHVIEVAFDDVVQTYRYNVAFLPIARGDANFTIEAEDLNNNGAKVGDAVNTMPYLGGAAANQPATVNVDFFDNDTVGDGVFLYRSEDPHAINMAEHALVNNLNMANRGSWDMTANYRIGWIGDNNWYNYTRTVPAGDYTVYAALSIDNTNPNAVGGRLALVDGDNCASEPLGTFNGYGSSAWGLNNLIALADANGSRAVYHSDGTEKTFRYFARSGDFDYIGFVPLTGVAISAAPASVVGANGPLAFTLVGGVDKASPSLTVNGSAMALTSTTLPNGVAVAANPAIAIGAPGTSHTYVLTFKDAAGTSYSKSGSFKISDGTFVIEAEDYNFGRGQTLDALSKMPYFGNGMAAICEAAVQGIDISNRDGFDSDVYRKEANLDGTPANVNIGGNMDGTVGEDNDVNRGAWDVTTNYKIGWVGTGDWQNYTRTIPAGNYEVWAALSIDNTNDDALRGSLQLVTDGEDTETQALEQLGTFSGKGAGGWGANRLVQLKTSDGQPAVVGMPGTSVTLRASIDSGDFDYLKLVPTTSPLRPKITGIVKNADGSITITWTGGGVLEAALSLDGPWQTVDGAASPFTFATGAPAQFGRIRRL